LGFENDSTRSFVRLSGSYLFHDVHSLSDVNPCRLGCVVMFDVSFYDFLINRIPKSVKPGFARL
jgi:hypothetical protein